MTSNNSRIYLREALRWFLISLGILAIVAGYRMVVASLWVDELFSVATAGYPIGEMIGLLRGYQPGYFDHPPLYFIMLRSVLLYSEVPWVLRLPSLLFIAGTLAIIVSSLGRDTSSPWLKLAAIALVLFQPELLCHATDIRMYAMVGLLAAGTIMVLEVLQDATTPHVRRLAFGALTLLLTAAIYTSTLFLLIFPGLGILAIVWVANRQSRPAGLILLAALATATILYIPWMPTILRMVSAEGSQESPLSLGKYSSLLPLLRGIIGTVAALPVMLVGWGWIFFFSPRSERFRWLGYLGALLVLPVALLVILSPESRALDGRYAIPGIVVCLMGTVRGVAECWNRFEGKPVSRWALAAIWGLGVCGGIINVALRHLHPARGWWNAAEIVEREVLPNDVVMTGTFLSGEALIFHMKQPEGIQFLHYQTKMEPFLLAARSPEVAWYVNGGPLPESAQAVIDRYFSYRYVAGVDEGTQMPITVYSKRAFSTSEGDPAVFQEPIPLPYE